MKRTSILLILFLSLLILQVSNAYADKEQILFSIQKVKSTIEKAQDKSEEAKTSLKELQKAREYLKQAETELNINKNWIGSVKKEAEPLITHYIEMADINASIALSRLEKINQEKENARLEKLIPELEAKIKVFDDKNIEIQRLKAELEKPCGEIRNVNSEIARLKKEKSESDNQVSQLKAANEKLSGKIEALNELIVTVRKDLAEKIKVIDNLSADNRLLKDNVKNLELQKGSDFVAIQAELMSVRAKLKLINTFAKIGLLSRTSDDGFTFIIPRKKLIKTSAKSIALSSESEYFVSECTEILKSFPGSQLLIKVHGFGKPASIEGDKATMHMAVLLKNLFTTKGIDESFIQVFGAGTAEPLFSKAALEENRCAEITINQLTAKK